MLDILKGRGQGDGGDKNGVASTTSRRPVIGLALGGGAARGFAHIGIMRTLVANGITPSVLVGTSIGAVIGGETDTAAKQRVPNLLLALGAVNTVLNFVFAVMIGMNLAN